MNKKYLHLLSFLFFITIHLQAQNVESRFGTPSSDDFILLGNDPQSFMESAIPDPPPVPVRTMAEWEELQAVVITWHPNAGFNTAGRIEILRNIVRFAKEEVNVIIVCSSAATVQSSLDAANIDWSTNVTFVEDEFDSIWVRDYGPNTVYANDVEEQYFIDWIYNRPRYDDNVIPDVIGNELGIPVYTTTVAPLDLVHTGGNFMSDGMGTAFSSFLVLDENDVTNTYGDSNHSEADIDNIMASYMGIGRYIKMEHLPFDMISHIDMHMKLLDEETLLVGEYPEGVADGPQLEANIQYVLDNFQTPYGNDYNVIRIPMPPDFGGNYPDNFGDYRTYANSIILNKTILVPFYEEQFDTTAQRVWEEAMPGYNIQGINCNAIIGSLGAIHCITKEVGVSEPLLVNHAKVREGCEGLATTIETTIQHHSGIAAAELFYTTDLTLGYQSVPMSTTSIANEYVADIPAQALGSEVYYYIQAEANDGKEIVRPLVAPTGYFHFSVADCSVGNENVLLENIKLEQIYPNPASAITVIPVSSDVSLDATIIVTDILGREIETVFDGKLSTGENNYFIHADKYETGTYFVSLKTENQTFVQKLIVK